MKSLQARSLRLRSRLASGWCPEMIVIAGSVSTAGSCSATGLQSSLSFPSFLFFFHNRHRPFQRILPPCQSCHPYQIPFSMNHSNIPPFCSYLAYLTSPPLANRTSHLLIQPAPSSALPTVHRPQTDVQRQPNTKKRVSEGTIRERHEDQIHCRIGIGKAIFEAISGGTLDSSTHKARPTLSEDPEGERPSCRLCTPRRCERYETLLLCTRHINQH